MRHLLIATAVAAALFPSRGRAADGETFLYIIDLQKGICDIVENKILERARPLLARDGWTQSLLSFNGRSLVLSGRTEGIPSSIILFETRSGCIEGLRSLKKALRG